MRVVIAAVGRLKAGPERTLFEHYCSRFDAAGRAVGLGPIDLREVPEGKGRTAELRRAAEAEALLDKLPDDAALFVLDERGKALTSRAFAERVGRVRDDGTGCAAFLVGGPDGHGAFPQVRASLKLSLGAMTLPHGLARVVLSEQLYRAATILSGHPYHRD